LPPEEIIQKISVSSFFSAAIVLPRAVIFKVFLGLKVEKKKDKIYSSSLNGGVTEKKKEGKERKARKEKKRR